jgi:hypothetical protein
MNPEVQNNESEITINLTRNTGYRQIKFGVSKPGSFTSGAASEDRADIIDSLSRCIPQGFKGEVRVKSEYRPGMHQGKYDEFLSPEEVKEIRQQLQEARSDIRMALTTQEIISKIKGIFSDIAVKNKTRGNSDREVA